MKFTLATLSDAVSRCISPALADGVRGAFRAAYGPDAAGNALSAVEAGDLIVRALCRSSEAAKDAHLSAVDLLIEGELFTLSPEEAHGNPLLREWLPDNLAEAIAAPLSAGVALSGISPFAPHYGFAEIVDHDGRELEGIMRMTFRTQRGDIQAFARYGAQPANMTFATSRKLSGPHLALAGFQAAHRCPAPGQDASVAPVGPAQLREMFADPPPTRH